MNASGLLLILFGLVVFSYEAIHYNKQEKIAEIGNLQLHADTPKTIWLPSPLAGGVAVAAGVALLFLSNRRKQ
jgi:uncharacterized protein YjeT (DUF2065 family)